MNLVKSYFVLLVIQTLCMNMLLILFKQRPPAIVARISLHRKFRHKPGSYAYLKYLEIPKPWKMKHCYAIGTLYSLVILYLVFHVYFLSKPVPHGFNQLVDRLASEERTVTINATSAFLGVALLCSQIWKRLYLCTSVCVFSKDKVNILMYILAMFYYVAALTAIVAEAPGFAEPGSSTDYRAIVCASDLHFRTIVGVIVFYWAWYQQNLYAVILANLRKNDDGVVVTLKYGVPVGGLFEWLSAPHMFCEILMYFALSLILWGHTLWPYTFLWVLSYQCETALRNHWWYKSSFKDYPNKRRAVIPFIL